MTALALSSVKSSPSLTFPRHTASSSAPSVLELSSAAHLHEVRLGQGSRDSSVLSSHYLRERGMHCLGGKYRGLRVLEHGMVTQVTEVDENQFGFNSGTSTTRLFSSTGSCRRNILEKKVLSHISGPRKSL